MGHRDPETRLKYGAEYREKNRETINRKALEKYWTVYRSPEHLQKKKEYNLRKNYGLTPDDLENMKTLQRGLCFICQQVMTNPQIDHNHTTQKVRALLCSPCNTAIGLLKENPTLLREAAVYLEAFNE